VLPGRSILEAAKAVDGEAVAGFQSADDLATGFEMPDELTEAFAKQLRITRASHLLVEVLGHPNVDLLPLRLRKLFVDDLLEDQGFEIQPRLVATDLDEVFVIELLKSFFDAPALRAQTQDPLGAGAASQNGK
jgi:hypothetical protein